MIIEIMSLAIPMPSAKVWALMCAILIPFAGGVWKLTSVAAAATVKATITLELKPLVDEIKDVRKSYVDLIRYERDLTANEQFHKESASKTEANYKEILQLQRDMDRKLTEVLIKFSGK